jgi:cell division protein FtsB
LIEELSAQPIDMRLLVIALLIALVLLQYRLWLSEDGMREVWRLETQVEQTTADNRDQATRNAELEAEVHDLKEGLAAVEERARTELGMIGAEETFYEITPVR